MRLDSYLFEKGFARSRSRAANLIKMGFVLLNGEQATKTSVYVSENDNIKITQPDFASIGSFKLQKAFDEFSIKVKDLVCADIGAAHGGFSEVLLSNNAKKVYAVDVGDIDFPQYLMSDKIVFLPHLNARYLSVNDIGELVDFVTIDVSFISLKMILPSVRNILKLNGRVVALIKPQFEATKSQLSKKGLIKSQKTVETIIADIKEFCANNGFEVVGTINAPEYFADKNKEYLLYLRCK